MLHCTADVIIRTEEHRFYLIGSGNFNVENFVSLEAAERHHPGYYILLARQRPGRRRAIMGCAVDSGRLLRTDEKRLRTAMVAVFLAGADVVSASV